MLRQIMLSNFLNKLEKLEDENNLQNTDLIANARQAVFNVCNKNNSIDLFSRLINSFLEFIELLSQCKTNAVSKKEKFIFTLTEDTVEQENTNLNLKNEVILIANVDLQCPICNEWLLKVTTTNCNHTFCQFCILKWLRINKACPICRSTIQYISNSVVVDNFISNLCHLFGGMLQGQRESVKISRSNDITNYIVDPVAEEDAFIHRMYAELGYPSEPPSLPSTHSMNLRSSATNNRRTWPIVPVSLPASAHSNAIQPTSGGSSHVDSSNDESIEEDSFINELNTASQIIQPNIVPLLPPPQTSIIHLREQSNFNNPSSEQLSNLRSPTVPEASAQINALQPTSDGSPHFNPSNGQLTEEESFIRQLCAATHMRYPIVVPISPPRPQAPRMPIRDRLNLRDYARQLSNRRSSPIIPTATVQSNALQSTSEGSSHVNSSIEEDSVINELNAASQIIQPNMVPLSPPPQASRINLRGRSNSNDPSRVQLSYLRSRR